MCKLIMLTALVGVLVAMVAAGPAGAAVTAVNCAPFGADDLQTKMSAAAPGDTLLIRGTCTGNFTAAEDVTLQGASWGATLNGGGAGATLTVPGPKVTIRGLTLTGGLAKIGAGITIQGGATVDLVSSGLHGNTSTVAAGGIYLDGDSTLNLLDSRVSGNTTRFKGGGIASFVSTLTLTGSSVSGNTTTDGDEGAGGGIEVYASTTTLTASTVSGNNAASDGGGINVENGGTFRLTGSAVTGNTANGAGGGISNGGGALTLTGSSVDHNTSLCCAGDGIFNDSFPRDATLTINNSNVAFNRTLAADGGLFGGGGGIFNFAESGGTASMVATGLTMTGNTAPAGHGGAIDNENVDGAAALVTIAHSRIGPINGMNPNQASLGAGIYNNGSLGPAIISLQPGTIISHNQATLDGGGIYNTGGVLSIAPGVLILFNSPNNIG